MEKNEYSNDELVIQSMPQYGGTCKAHCLIYQYTKELCHMPTYLSLASLCQVLQT